VLEKVATVDKAAMRATANTAAQEVVAEPPPAPPVRTKTAQAPVREPAREKVVRERVKETRDTTIICHARRRVVGEERPSQDDARRTAENGWMGAVRYDHGERYQDINRAKDVRLLCGPSSVSAALKQPHFRCAVEATPCRDTEGLKADPDERRYDPPTREDQISRK
jgi:hypothetical protein